MLVPRVYVEVPDSVQMLVLLLLQWLLPDANDIILKMRMILAVALPVQMSGSYLTATITISSP